MEEDNAHWTVQALRMAGGVGMAAWYMDPDSPDSFLCGDLQHSDDELVVVTSVDEFGDFAGTVIARTDNIWSLGVGGEYLDAMRRLPMQDLHRRRDTDLFGSLPEILSALARTGECVEMWDGAGRAHYGRVLDVCGRGLIMECVAPQGLPMGHLALRMDGVLRVVARAPELLGLTRRLPGRELQSPELGASRDILAAMLNWSLAVHRSVVVRTTEDELSGSVEAVGPRGFTLRTNRKGAPRQYVGWLSDVRVVRVTPEPSSAPKPQRARRSQDPLSALKSLVGTGTQLTLGLREAIELVGSVQRCEPDTVVLSEDESDRWTHNSIFVPASSIACVEWPVS